MKADKDAVASLVVRTRHLKKRYSAILDAYKDTLLDPESTVEEIMLAKSNLLMNLLDALPLHGDDCYFCKYGWAETNGGNSFDYCVVCPYGTVHGRCDDEDSDYQYIRQNISELKQAIDERYYGHEFYLETKSK